MEIHAPVVLELGVTIDVSAVSTTEHDSEAFWFRLPLDVALPCYLRIRISTAIPNTASRFAIISVLSLAAGVWLWRALKRQEARP